MIQAAVGDVKVEESINLEIDFIGLCLTSIKTFSIFHADDIFYDFIYLTKKKPRHP